MRAVAGCSSSQSARPDRLVPYLAAAAAAVCTGVVYFAARYAYFGLLLPLPLYVKGQGAMRGPLADRIVQVFPWLRGLAGDLSWLVRLSVATLLATLVFRGAIATRLTSEAARGVWVVYSALILAAFGVAFLGNRFRFERARELLRMRSSGFAVFPALLVANGLMPYLGGKTEGSFAMFSNLRTEGGYSSHWLMPTWLQMWDYQRDLVTIRSTSIPKVQRMANQGFQWTYFELRSLIRKHPSSSIVYERNGVVASWKGAQLDPDLTRPENPFLRKFFWFRPVPIDATKTPCIH